jgi:cell division protein FtsZ
VTEAFGHADDILTTAAKGIADIITTTLQINTDINDVKTVMKNSGVAIMGSAQASGEHRSLRAVEQAMASPLLNDSNIKGARYVLVNVTCGEDEIKMDELGEITDYIQDAAGMTAEVIKGYGVDPSLGDKVNVTIIATGFNSTADLGMSFEKAPEKKVHILTDEVKKEESAPIVNETPVVSEITSYIKGEEKIVVADEIAPIVDETPSVSESESVISDNEPFMFVREETKEESVSEINFEKQVTFEFEIANNNVSIDEATEMREEFESPVMKNEEVIEESENMIIAKVEETEQFKKSQDRIAKLKELSFKLKSPNGLSEMENEPAYKRRNVNLDSTPHSSESQVSRYTLSEGDDKKAEIKPNNSFLHDNVD